MHSNLLITKVAMLVPLGTFIKIILLFYHLFGFISTWALNYIIFAIAPMMPNCPDEVIIITVVKNSTVIVPHFA